MQVSVLSGIGADEAGDFRSRLPVNLVPVPKSQGISAGYLRPADGINTLLSGPGVDRGGIVWRDQLYRVMGTTLVRVNADGTYAVLHDVGSGGPVSMAYSFDQLAIASGGRLYYYTPLLFTQVVDPDLRTCVDMIWVDGYFMSTDGEYLVVTELNAPATINPLKYGSSEADPDPVLGLLKFQGRANALNRYTIEQFENVGGTGFPFQRVEGALLRRGVIGTHAACEFLDQIAFVGSGHNEPVAVWLGANGQTQKISTREIDTLLQEYSERDLASTIVEARIEKSHQHLYIHLPDRTVVFDAAASQVLGEPVWFVLSSSLTGFGQYRAQHMLWCYDRWICGDPQSNQLGILTNETGEHYGQKVGWEFSTPILYNEGRGALFHKVELAALTGRVPLGADPTVYTSYTLDGETWSMPSPCKAGKQGARNARLTWLRQGRMQHWRAQRFTGTSDAHLSFARLEIELEGLNA